MSLRVWLPLTKDLRQQGLSEVTATSKGTVTLADSGKLGKCYQFDGGNLVLPSSSMTSFSECTVAFWVKINSWKTNWDTFFQAGLGSTPWNHYIFGVLRNSSNYVVFTISNGSTTSSANYYSSALILGEWMHLTFTYSNGKCKIYINGALDHEYSTSIVPNFSGITKITVGRSNNESAYPTDCYMNDFRIYDHCLSPMEVKQLSQGLVLHYPLNREGWGQENLMPNSTIMSVGSASASTGSWRVAGSSQMTRSRVAISDSPIGDVYGCQSVGLQTGQDASCWGIDGFPRENGTTYTISAWGRIVGGSSTAAMLGFSIYSGTTLDYGGTYEQAKSSDTKYYGSGAYDYAGGRLNPNGSWTRIYRTFTSTSTSDNIYVGFNTAKTGNSVTLQLCGVKLEKGDKVTSWCPKNTDDLADIIGLNDTTEYDTSGFGNNGTKNNVPTYSSDTAKYQVSTHLNGTNQTIQIPNLSTLIHDDIYTFNIWFKRLSTEPSSKPWETILGGPSGFELETCSANNVHDNKIKAYSWGSGTFEFELDKWNMLTLVRTASDSKFYLNGELKLTGTRGAIPSGNYFLGSWRDTSTQNYKGYICDARVYATALSADDVRALYENSAYIDNSGNTYAATYTEV